MSIKDRLAVAWRRLFSGREITPWDRRKSALTLESLARDPWACAELASRLDIEIDQGESAASFVAEMAQEASNELRAKDAEQLAAYYLRRKTQGVTS